MCRIAGIVDRGSTTLAEDIVRMTTAMRHGGPDDSGHRTEPEKFLALGHRRLSLIDLSAAGHQPMATPDGALLIVYNGELYNFREIRRTLETAGVRFNSASDTEVVLAAYRHWGTDCFNLFDGMFALAILDRQNDRLVIARDHAGIKPLYFRLTSSAFHFASEVRAFRALSRPFETDSAWRIPFLAFGHLPEPYTTIRNVESLPSGSFMTVDLSTLNSRTMRYARDPDEDVVDSPDEARRLVRDTLAAAVERHLISDAPIGVFLSGGIDSSTLALLARPFVSERLNTLSISFREGAYSEARYQQIVAQRLAGQHSTFEVTKSDFARWLPDALHAMDQPSIDAINSYFISRYAHEAGLKAVLAGHGADEIFGGYPTFRYASRFAALRRVPRSLLRLMTRFPDERLRKLGFAARRDPVGEYLTYRGLYTPSQIARMLDTSEVDVAASLDRVRIPDGCAEPDAGLRLAALESGLYLRNQLLKDADFMSMWHGLEVRVPFLDRGLLRLLRRIPSGIRFAVPGTKRLLIDAMRTELPREVWDRPKQGFTFPFSDWMRTSEITKPSTDEEHKLFNDFSAGRLAWSRYWCRLLSNRFDQFVPGAERDAA